MVLYIFAVLVLVLGMFAGMSLITSANITISNMLMPLQLLGSDVISNMLSPMLRGILTNVGIALIVLSIIFSVLLYTSARLIGHIQHLEARIARLEASASRFQSTQHE